MAKMKSRAEEQPKTPDEARAENEPEETGAESDDPEKEDEDDEEKPSDEAGEESEPEEEGEEPESEDEEEDEEEEDEPPPAREKKTRASAAASPMTLSAIFGLHANASQPAIRSAALAYVNLGKRVMSATETKSPQEAIGALQGLVDDAAEVGKLRADAKQAKKRENYRERMDLLRKLAAADLPGYSRGELFVDRENDGKACIAPAPVYAEMKLATLRGLVQSKVKGGSPRKSPFEPSKRGASEAQTEALIEKAKDSSVVKQASYRANVDEDKLAASYAALEAAGSFK